MGAVKSTLSGLMKWGLVNKVVPAAQLLEEAEKLARKFTALPGFALKMAKNAMNFGYDMPIEGGVKLELSAISQCFSTQDQKEGMKAFLEKRKPAFVGK